MTFVAYLWRAATTSTCRYFISAHSIAVLTVPPSLVHTYTKVTHNTHTSNFLTGARQYLLRPPCHSTPSHPGATATAAAAAAATAPPPPPATATATAATAAHLWPWHS